MIVKTKSGSVYELIFHDGGPTGKVRRVSHTQGIHRDFDDDWQEFIHCTVDPYKAPEQIIGYNMRIRLKDPIDPSKSWVSTNIVTEIE